MNELKIADHIHALAAKKRTSAIGHCALITTSVVATHFSGHVMFDWCIAVGIVLCSLIRWAMPLPVENISEKDARRWFMYYASLTVGSAILWGALAEAHIVVNGSVHRSAVFMLIINAGIAAAGSTSLTPYRRLASVFAFALLFPMGVALASVSIATYGPIIALLVIYQIFLMMQVRVNSEVVIKLREREEQYRHLVEASHEGIIIHENGVVLEVNPAFTRMFGFEQRDMYKTSIFAIVHPEDRQRTLEEMRVHSEDRRILRAIHKDGSVKTVEVRARTTQYKGINVRVTCIQDVTLQFEAERAVRESNEARQRLAIERENAALEALRVKTEFLTNMSHEIRTPLNAIIGLTDLLEETTDADVKSRYLHTLKRSGEGLLNLVNDILDFSKIDNGTIAFENNPINISGVIEDQCDLLAGRALAKGLTLSTYIDPSLPVSVQGDGGRISQIVLNLTANAIKFTETGSVTVRALNVGRIDGDVRVRFEVQDTGIGVPKELEHKIFHTFSQADSSMSRRFGGTGLGLAICKRLVDGMRGIIAFDSRENEGTLFWVEIPLPVLDEKTFGATRATPDLNLTIVTDDFPALETIRSYANAWKIPVKTMTLQDRRALPFVQNEIVIGAVEALTAPTRAALGASGYVAIDRNVRHRVESVKTEGRLRSLASPVHHSDLFDALVELATPKAAPVPTPLPASPAAAPFEPALVLVVEDNSTNQMLIMAILQRLGLQAQAVVNGLEAVDANERQEYDLILMDCQMPEMDGYEATRKIRERERVTGKHVPIVALTANVMREDRERCVESGMDGFIPKPVRRDKLISEMGRFLKAAGGGNEKVG